MDLYDLQQLGYHAQVQAGIIQNGARAGVNTLKAGAEEEQETQADETESGDEAAADSLLAEIEDAFSELRSRNSDLRGWWRGLIGEFDGGPSVIGSMTAPTTSQDHRLEWTQGEFAEALAGLDRVIAETVPALNEILEEAGIEEIEVPDRGSGAEEFK